MNLASLRSSFVILALTFCANANGQIEQSSVKLDSRQRSKPSITPASTNKTKLTPQQQRAVRLLTSARTEAAGLEPEMRAFVLWHAAKGFEAVDPAKSKGTFNDAFLASQSVEEKHAESEDCGMDEVCHVKQFLQAGILADIATRDPDAAQDLLPQAEDEVRDQVTSLVIEQYISKKDFGRAEALLSRMAGAKRYPYHAASGLMSALPAGSAQQLSVFLQAVANFRQNGADDVPRLTGDLGEMVARFWQSLPPSAVLDAIDALLNGAKEQDKRQVQHIGFSARGGKSGSFNSGYEVRLFQVIPILEDLDKPRAEDLKKENASLRAMTNQYPQGLQSFAANGKQEGGDLSIYSSEYSADNDPARTGESDARQRLEAEILRRTDRIAAELKKDPKQALTDAEALPLAPVRDIGLSPRVNELMKVARAARQKHPDIAKSALDASRKNLEDMQPLQRGHFLIEISDLYVLMDRPDDARKSLQESMKTAEKLYAQDADANDPNLAFKGVWPSTGLWWECVQSAATISPDLPEQLIGEIPDAEIATYERVAWANSLLGRRESPELAQQHKNGGLSIVSF